jgi:hypothetical protein
VIRSSIHPSIYPATPACVCNPACASFPSPHVYPWLRSSEAGGGAAGRGGGGGPAGEAGGNLGPSPSPPPLAGSGIAAGAMSAADVEARVAAEMRASRAEMELGVVRQQVRECVLM